jgi:hypothetical protein
MAILIRRGINHSVILGFATPGGYCRTLSLATRPVHLMFTYLSPTRSLIESDLTESPSEGFPVFVAGDLNAKDTDWNSSLIQSESFAPDWLRRQKLQLEPNHGSVHTTLPPTFLI